MKFWITVKAKISEEKAQAVYKQFAYAKINMFVENSMHVYGEADENIIKEILYACGKLGADIQLNIG